VLRDAPETWPANWPILLERAALVLLLLAAFVPRARTLGLEQAGGDRAAGAVLSGPDAGPLVQRSSVGVALSLANERPGRAALLLQTLGLAAHLLAAAALAWMLRMTHGTPASLFALALWGTLPIALLHGTLWGRENLGLATGLLGAGLGLRAVLEGGTAPWVGLVLVGLAGAGAGWTCAALLVAVSVATCAQRGRENRALLFAGLALALAGVTAAVNLPWLASPTAGEAGRAPLEAFGWMALLVCLIGACLRAVWWSGGQARASLDRAGVGPAPRLDLVLPLLVAGLAAWKLEGERSLVLLTPAFAAGGAAAFMLLARPLLRLRAGLGPVVIAVGLVAIPGLANFEHLRAEHARWWSEVQRSPARTLLDETHP
jgi:hypothetical protein